MPILRKGKWQAIAYRRCSSQTLDLSKQYPKGIDQDERNKLKFTEIATQIGET